MDNQHPITTYRAICAELIDALDSGFPAGRIRMSPLADLARALLDQPVAESPAAVEVAAALIELRSTVMGLGQMGMHVAAKRVERAADLLQRQHPQPVAVSERLPGPKDCDAEDNCWWFDPHADGAWYVDTFQSCYAHWLPANALPTPEATNG